MDIQKLKGFLAVARYKSFSQAAKRTFRTQPAVTVQVKLLEDELGVSLFDRSGSKIELTADGKILLELASPFIDEAESLTGRFNDRRKIARKEDIVVATHNSVMQHLLPSHIAKLTKSLPQVKFQFLSRSREEIIDMVASGEAHLGITSLRTVPASIEYSPIANYRRVLVAPKNHPLQKKAKLKLLDLLPYSFILPPPGSHTRAAIDLAFEQAGSVYRLAMEITGREAIKAYIKLGLGISIMNEYYLPETDRAQFHVRDVSSLFGKSERGVLTKKNRFLSDAIKTVLSELRSQDKQERLF